MLLLLLLLLVHHCLRRCDHYIATSLATQHLFEFWFVLGRPKLIVLSKVNTTTIRKVSLILIIVGVG